ncbi:translocation/assembly module TamB domain-containing protein [Desulfocastanea catecholica]
MKRTAFFLVSLLLLLSACFVFIFTTESGLLAMQKGINRFTAGKVFIGQAEGRLSGNWSLTNLRLASSSADIGVDRLETSWRPGSLLRAELNIVKIVATGVDIVLKDDPADAPDNAVVQLPRVLLPVAVLVDGLVVNKLTVRDSDGTERFSVDRLLAGLEGNAGRLAVKTFELHGPDIGLALHGNIDVGSNWSLDLLGKWHLAGFGFHPMAGILSATGPLSDPHVELDIQSPGDIRVKADLVNLLQQPQWTAQLEANNVDLSALIEDCPKIELATVKAAFTGNFDNYRGHVQAEGRWDTLDGMHLVSDLAGDFLGIDFQSLRIDSSESSAEVSGGKISWADIFSWEGRFLFKGFDPSVISEELQGRLNAMLVSKGNVTEHGVVASFEIAELDGVLRDHQVAASGNVFLTETEVHTDGLTLRSGEVAGLASIENGLFSWADEPHWSAEIRLDQFDPSWLYEEFPGSVNGSVKTEGKLADGGLEASLHIDNVSGTLRGNVLSGGGKISLVGDTLNTTGLALRIGPSELAVNGRAGESLAVDFSLSSPDIGTLLPESKGSLLVRGSLQGSRNAPHLDADLQGTGLRYREYSLDRVQGEIETMLTGDGQLTGSFFGEGMSLGGFFIDKGRIELDGSLARHHIVVEGSTAKGKLAFRASGSYRQAWQGELSHFQWAAGEFGVWRQEEKAAMTAGRDGVSLKRFCLKNGESEVCLDGDVQLEKEGQWAMQGKLSSVPLNWLEQLELIPVPVNGNVHAEIAAKGNSHRVISAKAEFRVPTADISVEVEESEPASFHFDDSVLALELTDGVLQADFNLRMRNGSQLVLAAEVEGAGDFSVPILSLPLRGDLELKEFDLDMLRVLTGYGVEPTGKINNALTLAGTVGQPKLYGAITLRDGSINLPYQGITLENIVLSVAAGEETAQVTARATSGPGQVTAVGTLLYGDQGFEGVLTIKGSNFLLVNLPEYAFRVNPEVLLTFSNDKAEIKGTIDVPHGLIAPHEMRDSISASEDVILVSGTREERLDGLPFTLDIKVRLGDDVRIDGYGLTGRLDGDLRVYTTPDDSFAGRGDLDLIEGNFVLYGRTLKIMRGRMLFSGGPIDNPGVDVRAQIKVSDEEARGKGYTVGVDISGLAQDLQYRLFSNPFMEDAEILSLMIVGHSFASSTPTEGSLLEAAAVTLGVKGSLDFVQGIGNLLMLDDLHLEGSSSKENVSLVIGKKVTKNLYIGYDLNVFNQLGQFRVRYDLTHGFSVETKSSSEATGADLLYTFER